MRLARPEQRGPEGTPNGPVGRKSNAALKQGLIGRAALAVTLAVCASFVASSTSVAAATKTVSFIGHYKGDASLLINNGSVTISSVAGKGTGTLFGASTVLGKGSASSTAQCDPFTGTGSISGASGKLDLRVTESKSSGCSSGQSGPVTVTFHGVAVVTGGSGSAKGASGNLKFNGTLKLENTSGSQNGPYTVTLSGELTVKG